jgi:hypothetical protein
MSDRALRALISVLLVVSAALFAIGVAIERNDTNKEHARAARAGLAGQVLLLADADQGKGEHIGGPSRSPHKHGSGPAGRQRTKKRATETPAEHSHESGGKSGHESGGESGHESAAQLAREHGSERIFGINTESTGFVAAAVAVSLLLAIALWLRPGLVIALAIVAFGLAAAVFDVREVLHQIDESHTNLIVIAALVAFLHLVCAGAAVALAQRRRPSYRTRTDLAPS